jgi:dGTPase
MFGSDWGHSGTYEAELVKISDAIAYINHDIGDAVRAGMLNEDNLPQNAAAVLGHSHAQRVNTMVTDIIENSWAVSGNVKTDTPPVINMSDVVRQATDELRSFMFEHVYNVQSENADARHARKVVKGFTGIS